MTTYEYIYNYNIDNSPTDDVVFINTISIQL